MIYGINYGVCEWFMMFMNSCIYQWSDISYLRLRMTVLMDITRSNGLVVLETE